MPRPWSRCSLTSDPLASGPQLRPRTPTWRRRISCLTKLPVSLPRTLAERAERAARRRGIPRSRLYALALEAFLVGEQESDEELTARINTVLADEAATRTAEHRAEDESLEAWLTQAGRREWDAVEWEE